MIQVVLDCSTALTWYFEDETDPDADDLYVQACGSVAELIVPAHFFMEVTNGLLVGERRQRCTPDDILRHLRNLKSLSILMEADLPLEVLGNVYALAARGRSPENRVFDPARRGEIDFCHRLLARQYHLTAYDAAYLELARRHELPIATLDRPLRAAAQREGVALFEASH